MKNDMQGLNFHKLSTGTGWHWMNTQGRLKISHSNAMLSLSTLNTFETEMQTGSRELAALERTLDAITEEIGQLNLDMEVIKKRLEGTRIPALTEERDHWRKEVEGLERRLREKESDITDLQRERLHFTKRMSDLKEELEKVQDRNKEIDRETASLKQSIESAKGEIAALEEKQKMFSGELEGLRAKREEAMAHFLASEKKILEFDSFSKGHRYNFPRFWNVKTLLNRRSLP